MYKYFSNILFLFTIILFGCGCNVKTAREKDERALRQRLDQFLKLTAAMKLDSSLDYVYPKVFDFIPRAKLKENKEESYQLAKGKAKLDSFRIDTLYPIFYIDNASYAWTIYSMVMEILIDSTDTVVAKAPPNKEHYPAPQSTLIETLSRNLGVKIISLDEQNGVRRIRMGLLTICAKDKHAKDWSFYTVIGNDTIAQKLFPKKVLEKFESYNQ